MHPLGEFVTALCTAGLVIEFLHEHPVTHFRMFDGLERDERGLWSTPPSAARMPLMFSLRAHRPA